MDHDDDNDGSQDVDSDAGESTPIVLDDFLRPMQELNEFSQISTIRMDRLVASLVKHYAGCAREDALNLARKSAKEIYPATPSMDLLVPRLWTKGESFI